MWRGSIEVGTPVSIVDSNHLAAVVKPEQLRSRHVAPVHSSVYTSICISIEVTGRCGRVVERRTFRRWTGVRNHLMPFRNLGNFVHPTLPCLLEETLVKNST